MSARRRTSRAAIGRGRKDNTLEDRRPGGGPLIADILRSECRYSQARRVHATLNTARPRAVGCRGASRPGAPEPYDVTCRRLCCSEPRGPLQRTSLS